MCSVDFPTEKVSDLQESQFGETKLEKLCTSVQKYMCALDAPEAPKYFCTEVHIFSSFVSPN